MWAETSEESIRLPRGKKFVIIMLKKVNALLGQRCITDTNMLTTHPQKSSVNPFNSPALGFQPLRAVLAGEIDWSWVGSHANVDQQINANIDWQIIKQQRINNGRSGVYQYNIEQFPSWCWCRYSYIYRESTEHIRLQLSKSPFTENNLWGVQSSPEMSILPVCVVSNQFLDAFFNLIEFLDRKIFFNGVPGMQIIFMHPESTHTCVSLVWSNNNLMKYSGSIVALPSCWFNCYPTLVGYHFFLYHLSSRLFIVCCTPNWFASLYFMLLL